MTTSTRLALVTLFLAVIGVGMVGVPNAIFWPLWVVTMFLAVWALRW